MGPYGASLADGSEYRGDYGRSVAELRAWHRPRIAALVEAGVDVLALETIPTLVEVEALLQEVAGTGVPCWLSITAAGDRTRAGEPAYAAFALAAEIPEVVAVGVNCLDPRGCPGPAGARRRGQRQARRRLSQPRRGLGRGREDVDRPGRLRPGRRDRLGGRRRPPGRRLLPGHARRHRHHGDRAQHSALTACHSSSVSGPAASAARISASSVRFFTPSTTVATPGTLSA